jgi:hypothetical protein
MKKKAIKELGFAPIRHETLNLLQWTRKHPLLTMTATEKIHMGFKDWSQMPAVVFLGQNFTKFRPEIFCFNLSKDIS